MRRWFLPSPVSFVVLSLLSCFASAIDVPSLLNNGQLPPEWKTSIGANTGGSIAPALGGLLLQSEPRVHGYIKRDSDAPGTDAQPLDVLVQFATLHETERSLQPGLFIYWDDANYTGLRLHHDGHVWAFCMNQAVWREQGAWGVLKSDRTIDGKKWREGWFRIRVLSRTVLLSYSTDGIEWTRAYETGVRPGAGKAPKIIVGRGTALDPSNKDGKPEFANDVQPDGNKTLVKTLLLQFRATSQPSAPSGADAIAKQDTWEQTLAAMETSGLPRQWTFAGPALKDGQRKTLAAPDLNDEWKDLKDPAGQPIKTVAWTRPEEEHPDGIVDLSEHLGQTSVAAGWARTEVQWPVEGEALLWYASANPCALYVNNVRVQSEREDNEHRAREKRCVRVWLKKGRNVIKARCWQSRGDWSLYLRVERNDPGYRTALLEKMLELFPEEAQGWRAAAARREIARAYEELGNYPKSIETYSKMQAHFANIEEHRINAFFGEIRLHELLRDGSALKAAGEAFLAKYPNATGSIPARRAVILGLVIAGDTEGAFKATAQFAEKVNGEHTMAAYRALAGALQAAGNIKDQTRALIELAGQSKVDTDERIRAAIESAYIGWTPELQRGDKKPDVERCKSAVQAFEKAMSLMPGSKAPMPAAFAQAAAEDFKAERYDAALSGYWGACLLALAASDPELAPLTAFGKVHNIQRPEKENNNPIGDANTFRRVLTRQMQEQLGDALPLAKWRVVAFNFEGQQTLQSAFAPEQNPNGEDYGNNRKWQNAEVDLENDWELFRGNNDQGIDINRWAENTDVAFVQRDFEVKKDGEPQLFVAAPGGWAAWIDGKPVGSNFNNKGFRVDKDRVPLKLSAGKHRLMLKLEAPQSGPFTFRARISHEPEFATYLYVQAQSQIQFPKSLWERRRDLGQLARDYLSPKGGIGAASSLYEAVMLMFAENSGAGVEYAQWVSDRYRESGEHEAAVEILRPAVIRLEAAAEYTGRGRTAADLRRRLALALVACGQMGAADSVLREQAARYPDDRDYYFSALTLRGCLRRDGGQSHTALPFFEEVVREYTTAPTWERQAWYGIDWARNFRPERLVLETPHEVQTALDAVRRQLNAGGAEDIERAMRNVSEALQGAAGALSRVADSPFFPRYVGAREYVRAMLESLPPATREVYAKVVREAARKRLNSASALSDTAALEAIANEYYFTVESVEARRTAGNLLLDRGQFAQAASLFQVLLRQNNGLSRTDTALLLAKLSRAQTGNNQFVGAQRNLERLKSELGGEQIPFGGKTAPASTVADKLLAELDTQRKASEPAQRSGGFAATPMANLLRTGATGGATPEPGPVIWAHTLIPQSAMAQARGAFDVELTEYASSMVSAANGVAYVSGFESLRAIEISTGRVKWSNAWGSAGPLVRGGYNGYPISAPTVSGGRVFIRALESGVASLRCYAADSGQLLWNSAASPELRPLAWIAEPAVAYGMVLAAYIEPGDMNIHGLAALDAQTGRTRWKSAIATGNTGIKITDRYYMSTLHLGPAAVDAGTIYLSTGMSSVAAVDAFSGEIKWLSAYPRLYFGDPRGGQSSAGFDLLLNTAKTFARGPLSPVLDDDTLIVAPKDSANIYCFNRQTGEVQWVREFADCRFIGGLVDNQLLVCDGGVQSIDSKTGSLLWENGLDGRSVVGQPSLSGGQLYIPTASALIRVDSKTGRVVGETAWDARVGALGSITIANNVVLGTNQTVIAALGEKNAARAELPLYEARDLESAGKMDEAAERYKQAMQNKDSAEFLTAFTARLRLLEKLGKKDDIKAMLDELEKSGPAEMTSFSGLWRIRRDVYLAAIRARVLGIGNASENPQGDLAGTLVYAGEISGDGAVLCKATDSSDRVFALAGNDVICLKGGKTPEILWRAYAGPGMRELRASSRVVAAMSELRIVLLDAATGQTLGEALPPTAADLGLKRRVRMETRRFTACAPGENIVTAVAGELLCAWDIASGKLLWAQKLNSGYKPTSSELYLNNDRTRRSGPAGAGAS